MSTCGLRQRPPVCTRRTRSGCSRSKEPGPSGSTPRSARSRWESKQTSRSFLLPSSPALYRPLPPSSPSSPDASFAATFPPNENPASRRDPKIVRSQTVASQEQLRELLKAEGFDVTQATLSRDIRDLGLAKVAAPDGGSHYAPPPE